MIGEGLLSSAGAGPMPGAASTDADAGAFGERRDPWNRIRLGGVDVPGIAEVSGSGIEHQIDVKKTPGKNGATFADLGRQIGRYDIKLTFWSQQQWDSTKDLRSVLQPTSKSGKLQALDVEHPGLNWLGVRSLYVTTVGVPQPGPRPGMVEITLRCLEYRKTVERPAAAKNVAGSKALTGRSDPQAPNYSTPGGAQTRVDLARPSLTDAGPEPGYTPATIAFTPGPT